jgi:hypothetical protein
VHQVRDSHGPEALAMTTAARFNRWLRPILLGVLVFLCAAQFAYAWENTAGEVVSLHNLRDAHETPHIKWARPYAGGRLRVLYLLASNSQGMETHAREAVEFAQRFDVELDTVYYFHFYKKQWFGGVAGQRRLQRIFTETSYDLYIFQDISPQQLTESWLGAPALKALVENVRNGSGLVVMGADHGEAFKERTAIEATSNLLPPDFGGATFGEGRIAHLPERSPIEYKIGWQVEYENWQAQFGRAVLWAAHREPAASCRLAGDHASVPRFSRDDLPARIQIEWTGVAADAAISVGLRRSDGAATALPDIACRTAEGTAKLSLPLLRAGTYHLDMIVKGPAGGEGFATHPVQIVSDTSVVALNTDTNWAEIGDTLAVDCTVEGVKRGQTLRIRLMDPDARVLVREDFRVGRLRVPESFSKRVEFTVEPWYPMLTRVEAVVLDRKGEVTSDYRFFNVTRRNREKFNFVLWGFPQNQALAPYAAETMQRLGVTGILSSRAAPRAAAAYDIAWVPWTGGHVRAGPHAESWHGTNAANYFIMRMKESRGHGVLTYSLGDEGAVEGAGVLEPAMKAYRDYLAAQYGEIGALNTSWGTEFEDYADVVLTNPKDTHEAQSLKENNYPRWYDRQAFRSYNFVEFCKMNRDRLLEFDSEAMLGFEGSGRFARRGDPYLICKELKFWVPYGGSLDELVRSLTADKPYFLRGNWMGYHRSADGLANKYWRMVMSGANSVWWWMWSTIGAWEGLITPDLGTHDYIQEFVDDTAIVREGLGALIQRSVQEHDGIALLHSMPSAYAATVDENLSYGDYEPNHRGWFNVIHDQPMEFRYITARMLRPCGELEGMNRMGTLPQRTTRDPVDPVHLVRKGSNQNTAAKRSALEGFHVLVLPQALAMSDESASTIREFVSAGGTVIADLRPGIYDEHLKPRGAGVLDDLFGIMGPLRSAAKTADVEVEGDYAKTNVSLKWPDMLVDPGITLSDGTALGRAGDVPVCIVKTSGPGRAILLNWSLSSFPSRTSARGLRTWGSGEETPPEIAYFFRRLLEQSGARRPVVLTRYKAKDPYIGNVRVQRWRNDGIELLALHRETGSREQAGTLIPEERHIYDLRDGVYLGKSNWWMNQVYPTRARFLALLPQRCPAPKLKLPRRVEHGEVVTCRVSVPGAAGLHAIKTRVRRPDGTPAAFHDQTVVCDGKPRDVALPIAHNDPVGEWSLSATDVYTAETRKIAKFTVR